MNLVLLFAATIILIVLLLYLRNKNFRFSKLIKILLLVLFVGDAVLIFAAISAIFSGMVAIWMAIAIVWIVAEFECERTKQLFCWLDHLD